MNKKKTTTEQRIAWQEIHTALIQYIMKYGRIEIGDNKDTFFIDYATRFPEAGKIYCPDAKKRG